MSIRWSIAARLCLSPLAAIAQVPAGYHLGEPVTLPQKSTSSLLGGRFRATVQRVTHGADEQRMLDLAERLYPDREVLLQGITDPKRRDEVIAMDTANGGGSHVGSAGVHHRSPGIPADRWWGDDFDGTWEPFAVSGAAVAYYLARIRDIATGFGPFAPEKDHRARFEYHASVERTHEDGAAYVVRLTLQWDYECGPLCGMSLLQERRVFFDRDGHIVRIAGDRWPMVVVS